MAWRYMVFSAWATRVLGALVSGNTSTSGRVFSAAASMASTIFWITAQSSSEALTSRARCPARTLAWGLPREARAVPRAGRPRVIRPLAPLP
jgi:hypothetical protein